jgi:hypothetical protein
MIEIELEKIRCGTKAVQKVRNYFRKDHLATQYYQIIWGREINNFNDEGREFIQDFYANHRFGEPPLFLD